MAKNNKISNTKKEIFNTIYDMEYFASSSCFLYIGDVWVDEVVSLQWMVQQQKTPIYGYASQLWDDCSAGQVYVQGNFSINFTESGYLWAVLKRYKNMFSDNDFSDTTSTDRRPVWGSNVNETQRLDIRRMIQGGLKQSQKSEFYNSLTGYSTFNVNNPQDRKYEDVVEAFEDEIWNDRVTNTDLQKQIRRVDDNVFDNFDMYLIYGNYANPKANHTVRKFIDVRLISTGQSIAIDGQCVKEEYTFIARNVV